MKRSLSIPMIVGLAIGTTLLGTVTPAASQVSFADAVFSGYSTGTVLHTGALTAGPTGASLTSAEEAFSGASVASKGTDTVTQGAPGSAPGRIVNEMGVEVQPDLPGAGKLAGDRSFGRGSGLEVVAAGTPSGTPTVPLNIARVSSPPRNDEVLNTAVPADPLAYASAVQGEAHSDWNNNTCILGKPISSGRGFVADAQLVDTGTAENGDSLEAPLVATSATAPERAVNQSLSQTVVVPQLSKPENTLDDADVLGDAFGIGSETRQTLSPTTLFKGTPNELTIEVGGEFVLQAVAGGVPGSAWVRFAPEDLPSPSSPLVRVFRNVTDPVTGVVTKDDLIEPIISQGPLGPEGLSVPLPGVGEITVGEAPRAIGSDDSATPAPAEERADGTVAAGAVDVLRIEILANPDLGIEGFALRLGHMEARAQVPAGGFDCPIPVNKDANPREVNAGERFTYTIEVVNPFDCVLDPVKVVDTINVDPGIKYTIQGSNPPASSTTGNTVTFDNIGPIAPRTSKTITIDVEVAADSAGGLFENEAEVSATCANGSGEGLARIRVPVSGLAIVQIPRVNAVGAALAATGRPSWLLPAAGLVLVVGFGGIVGIRRLRAT